MTSVARLVEPHIGASVFVTGAGGFIGPVIVGALREHGARVHALVGAPGQPVRSLPPDVPITVADIADTAAVRKAIRGAEIVIHMAGPASVRASFECPEEYARIHALGTSALLDACFEAGLERFVYLSSAEVYGRTGAVNVPEDAPLQPRSPYGAAKVDAEQFVRAFAHTSGIRSVILRPFSIYGPGLSDHSLIGTIVRMGRFEESVVLNDLRPVRDYCFIDDLAAAVMRSCTAAVPGLTTLNIGTGSGTSVAELADRILAILGRGIPVCERPDQQRPLDSEIYRLVADTTRAHDMLGWNASTRLETGLRRVIGALEDA